MTFINKGPPLPPEVEAELRNALDYDRRVRGRLGLQMTREWFERRVQLEDEPASAPAPAAAPEQAEQPFGQWLKARREERGLTLRDVERITSGKLSNAALSQIETGKTENPGVMTVLLISAALGLSDQDVLHRARHGNAPQPAPDFCPHCGRLVDRDKVIW